MAHHTATLKSIRQAGKRRERNLYRLKRLRTACRAVEEAVEKQDVPAAQAALVLAQSNLARGVKANVIKAGNASRKISRLNAKVKAIATGSAPKKATAAAQKKAAAPKKKATAKK